MRAVAAAADCWPCRCSAVRALRTRACHDADLCDALRPLHPFSRADLAWMKWRRAARPAARCGSSRIWSGSLLSSEHSMTELRHGVADIGLITPIYARGGAHLIRVQAGFYGGARHVRAAGRAAIAACSAASRSSRASSPVWWCWRCRAATCPGIVTRDRPVRTLGDLRGLRLRAPAELLPVLDAPRRRPRRHADGRGVLGARQGRARRRGRARGHASSRCTSPRSRATSTRSTFRAARTPARAMSERRWRSTRATSSARCCERGIAIWERALAARSRRAQRAGEAERATDAACSRGACSRGRAPPIWRASIDTLRTRRARRARAMLSTLRHRWHARSARARDRGRVAAGSRSAVRRTRMSRSRLKVYASPTSAT